VAEEHVSLARLVELYGPPRRIQPHGPSLVIPNILYTQQLSVDLEKAGIRSFSGQHNRRVAWIIPLNQHRTANNPCPAKTYRFGRAWTKEEDKLLLEAMSTTMSYNEIAKKLSGKLDRTPNAIRIRLRRLTKRIRSREAATPKPSKPPIILMPKEDRVTPALDTQALTSLLSACLCLAENSKHLLAIRILISRALQLLQGQVGEAANPA